MKKALAAAALACAFASPALAADPVTIDFEKDEAGKAPAGFTTARTGEGADAAWSVVESKDAPSGRKKVLAQTSTDDTDMRFPLCVHEKIKASDVTVSVQFKPISGKVDQAGGLVARFQDKDNYYVVRANANEDNVRLYHVTKGKRKQFAGENVKVESGKWHALKLVVKGSHFQVHFDGKLLFEADDETIKDAGKVGLWTKADSVTHFDDLKVEAGEAKAAEPEPEDREELVAKLQELEQSVTDDFQAKKYDAAIEHLNKIVSIVEKSKLLPARVKKQQASNAHYNLACAYSLKGKKAEGVEHFAKSIELGFKDWEHIDDDHDLDNIRDEEGFKKAIEKGKNPDEKGEKGDKGDKGEKKEPKKEDGSKSDPF